MPLLVGPQGSLACFLFPHFVLTQSVLPVPHLSKSPKMGKRLSTLEPTSRTKNISSQYKVCLVIFFNGTENVESREAEKGDVYM